MHSFLGSASFCSARCVAALEQSSTSAERHVAMSPPAQQHEKHIYWTPPCGLMTSYRLHYSSKAHRRRPSCQPAACGTCGRSLCCRHSSHPRPHTLHAGQVAWGSSPDLLCYVLRPPCMRGGCLAERDLKAPLLVQNWMPRENAVLAAAVGPPWILTSSGGASPAAHQGVPCHQLQSRF
jgi:hypothetical protein